MYTKTKKTEIHSTVLYLIIFSSDMKNQKLKEVVYDFGVSGHFRPKKPNKKN